MSHYAFASSNMRGSMNMLIQPHSNSANHLPTCLQVVWVFFRTAFLNLSIELLNIHVCGKNNSVVLLQMSVGQVMEEETATGFWSKLHQVTNVVLTYKRPRGNGTGQNWPLNGE